MNKLRMGVLILFVLVITFTAWWHPSLDRVKPQMAQDVIVTGETEVGTVKESVTGEDNEEWAAYKALLTGDFSRIENMDDRMHLEFHTKSKQDAHNGRGMKLSLYNINTRHLERKI